MNFTQVKERTITFLKTSGILSPTCGNCPNKVERDEAFRAGAKAMFDSLAIRAANNYDSNLVINQSLQKENALVMAWAEDAFMEVDPDDFDQWKILVDMYQQGYEDGATSMGFKAPA